MKLFPGQSVTWMTTIGTKRFGCVMGFLENGKVDVQASNARLHLDPTILVPCDCDDPITADQREIYR